MSERPLPEPTEDSAPYWTAAAAGRLILQRCRSCGTKQFYPRAICSGCMSSELEWFESEGFGVVHSFSRVAIAPSEAFTGDLPYVVALVRLDDGVQMLSRVVDCPPADVEIGLRVRVDYERLSDEIALPVFRPERSRE